MHTNKVKTTIEVAISKCIDEGTPESLKEFSQLIREQEDLQENKHSLYKMIIEHLGAGATTPTPDLRDTQSQV